MANKDEYNDHTWYNVSDKLDFGDKQNGQTVKPQIQKFSALT